MELARAALLPVDLQRAFDGPPWPRRWNADLVTDACDCFDLPDANGGVIAAEMVHAAHVATLRFEFAQVTCVDEVLDRLSAAGG
jgi:hypothetical protein